MRFSRQEYWSVKPASPALAGSFFITSVTLEAPSTEQRPQRQPPLKAEALLQRFCFSASSRPLGGLQQLLQGLKLTGLQWSSWWSPWPKQVEYMSIQRGEAHTQRVSTYSFVRSCQLVPWGTQGQSEQILLLPENTRLCEAGNKLNF